MSIAQRKDLPSIGIFACFSGGSNTGSLTGMAALEIVKRLGGDRVGICSMPATLSGVPRQTALVKKISKIVIIDGCHNQCARNLLAGVGIEPALYVNLEEQLGLDKLGPFTSLDYSQQDVMRVADYLEELLKTL